MCPRLGFAHAYQYGKSSHNQSAQQSTKQLQPANPPVGLCYGNSLRDEARVRGGSVLVLDSEQNQGRRGKSWW
jgi:hypothetical protein